MELSLGEMGDCPGFRDWQSRDQRKRKGCGARRTRFARVPQERLFQPGV